MKVLENVGIGTELSKRQHLDGVVLTKECECGEEYPPMKVVLNMNLTI